MSDVYLYDLSKIRNLPILEVCDHLGIAVEKHGKNFWCKVRPERNASVILHTDSNYFYDFGNQRQGSVIDLVQYVSSCTVGEAIRFLAKSFGIEPCKDRSEVFEKPLSDREYRSIGLYGDLASKNISFPIESATVDELLEISYCYQIPMNQLRREDPSLYENIIRQKAVPFVDDLRNQYIRDVWNYYDLLCSFHNGALFFISEKTQEKFQDSKAALERAERALSKALYGTSISRSAPLNYDPLHIISFIQQGRLAVSLGSLTDAQLSEEASYEGCGIKYAEVSYDDYFRLNLANCRYCAVFNGKIVSLSYLDVDHDQVLPRLEAFIRLRKPTLSEQIESAGQKECLQSKKTIPSRDRVLS